MLGTRSLVQEVTVEAGSIIEKIRELTQMLNVSKVLVAFNFQCILLRKSAEGGIAANFVDFGQLNGPFRHDVAIILNSVNSVVKAVQFGEIERNKASVGVLLLSGGKGVVGNW
jgi:hypothetical protein